MTFTKLPIKIFVYLTSEIIKHYNQHIFLFYLSDPDTNSDISDSFTDTIPHFHQHQDQENFIPTPSHSQSYCSNFNSNSTIGNIPNVLDKNVNCDGSIIEIKDRCV